MSGEVLTDVTEGVGTITLNRPERLNSLSRDLIDSLAAALEEMESSSRVGSIVLTGAGGAFCSGGDVQDFHLQGGEGAGAAVVDAAATAEQREDQERTVGRIYRCRKPVLASLPGAVAGAGMGLALAADLRVGCTRTVFATAFGGVGLSGDYGVAWLLREVVGSAKARELLFLNERIRGEACRDFGLVNWIVADDHLAQRTSDIASQLARSSSRALEGMKKNLISASTADLSASMHDEIPLHKATGLSEEHISAVRAFVQKQAPVFSTGWH